MLSLLFSSPLIVKGDVSQAGKHCRHDVHVEGGVQSGNGRYQPVIEFAASQLFLHRHWCHYVCIEMPQVFKDNLLTPLEICVHVVRNFAYEIRGPEYLFEAYNKLCARSSTTSLYSCLVHVVHFN